jgi:exosortase A
LGFKFGNPIANNQGEHKPNRGSMPKRLTEEMLTLASSRSFWTARRVGFAWRAGLVCGLLLLIYFQVLAKLITDWWNIPDFSHGFLVPIFAGYLVWVRREELRKTRRAPYWVGVALVAFALFTLMVGIYGAELFLSRLSIVILLAGLALAFGGPQVLRELRFPILVLLLAIPIPAIIFTQITLPLQSLASELASVLLPIFGVPVLREGNIIQLPSMTLEVAEACSGIRSLMSLLTVAVFYGYFFERIPWKRVILALASIPIAIAANALRILGTGLCVHYWNPDKAVGFFHEFSGWVMFLVSLACLFFLHRLLNFFPAGRQHS